MPNPGGVPEEMPVSDCYRPEKALLALGDGFYDVVRPAEFPTHILRWRNDRAAATIGLDTLTAEEWRDHFAEFRPLPDNLPEPLAMRYHGHQFRVYNPDLGDGRGFTFAQMRERGTGRLLECGTKGSGQTPWSRQGDGRLTLKGGAREILATEMLEALGVNTSKSLSLFETGEALYRGDEPSPTRSSVLVRLSHSHIRIGNFQRHAFNGDDKRILALLDYCIRFLIPELGDLPGHAQPVEFLRRVVHNVARMGSQWMAAGFVHGVLNTDNINVMGESFDYGPWRFLPTYEPGFTAAYFDQTGLYCFGRQLEALHWNLTRLAECLLLVAEREPIVAALNQYGEAVDRELRRAYLARLNLASRTETEDDDLLRSFHVFLHESRAPYEQAFFDWYGGAARAQQALAGPNGKHYKGAAFGAFRAHLDAYEPAAPERLGHPYFQRETPVTMLIDDVEAIWGPIAEDDDWSLFRQKIRDIAEMRDAYGLSGEAQPAA